MFRKAEHPYDEQPQQVNEDGAGEQGSSQLLSMREGSRRNELRQSAGSPNQTGTF